MIVRAAAAAIVILLLMGCDEQSPERFEIGTCIRANDEESWSGDNEDMMVLERGRGNYRTCRHGGYVHEIPYRWNGLYHSVPCSRQLIANCSSKVRR